MLQCFDGKSFDLLVDFVDNVGSLPVDCKDPELTFFSLHFYNDYFPLRRNFLLWPNPDIKEERAPSIN